MIELTKEISKRLDSAIPDGNTVVAAYVDTKGRPHVSFYGSTHVHNPDELAIWIRNGDSELLKTIQERPHISFLYGDISTRFYVTFEGRAQVEGDEAARQHIYDSMHPIERKYEPEMKGTAVVVELDRVTVLTADGKQTIER